MADNSLLIYEPVNLSVAALQKFNQNFDDPLTYTVKFWSDILNCLDLAEMHEKPSFFETAETLLSNLIQDYSIWHPAINSITNSFQISKYGQKSRKADLNFYKVMSWYVFYNDKSLFRDVVKFLGGYKKATKTGTIQKCRRFLEYLVDDAKTVVLQLYAALTEHYDVNFVENNILPRYDYNYIHDLLKKLEVPVYNVKQKPLTVPKSPNLILKSPVQRIADFDVKAILYLRAQEERANINERIVYAHDIPASTYYYQELKKPAKPKATSVHSFKLTKKKATNGNVDLGSSMAGLNQEPTFAEKKPFKATPMPKSSIEHPQTGEPKENISTILRKIATLKNKQEAVFKSVTSQQFGNDATFKKFQAQVGLENAIKNYEQIIGRKLAADLSFENAIIATNAVTEVKTHQNKILKENLEKDLTERNDIEQKALEDRYDNAKEMDKILKEALEASKTNLLLYNQTAVKTLTDELSKLVKKAMAEKRQILIERQEYAVKIRAEEAELKRKFSDGEFNKVIDWYGTNNNGLLEEMSLKEMKMRFEFIKKKNIELNEALNLKIKNDKVEKDTRISETYDRLVKFDKEERRRDSEMTIKSSLSRRVSMDSFRSNTIELLSGQLEAAKAQRIKIREAQKV